MCPCSREKTREKIGKDLRIKNNYSKPSTSIVYNFNSFHTGDDGIRGLHQRDVRKRVEKLGGYV
jgi:hypothetical protein